MRFNIFIPIPLIREQFKCQSLVGLTKGWILDLLNSKAFSPPFSYN